MKTLKVFILLTAVLPIFNFFPVPIPYSSKPIIIAELFTSEGCSSCPDAEALLKEMADLTAKEKTAMVGLAFHITYWDHLGWKDPYGQTAFTNRQKKYGAVLNSQQYTPQVVVNGEFEFVGGNPFAFRTALTKAAGTPYDYILNATAIPSNNQLIISYSLNKKPRAEQLNIALVETLVENHIRNGENKNRTLKHYNVVRKFHTVTVKPNDELQLDIPPDLDLSGCELILYVQHPRNLRIVGATQIILKQE